MADIALLQKILKNTSEPHRVFKAAAEQGRSYYNNRSDICGTGAAAIAEVNGYLKKLGKNPLKTADNRIPTNWHKIFTDQKVGYMFTYPPQFDMQDDAAAERIAAALGGDFPKVIKQLGVDAANCGVAWLAYWYNDGEPFGYWPVDPAQMRVVFDSASVKPKVQYVLREWTGKDDNDNTVTHYELWSDTEVSYFVANGAGTPQADISMGENGVIAHTYGRIPFIAFRNNADGVGDLHMYKQLIDSMDKLISGFANDIDDIQEIIWVIKNYAGELTDTEYDKDGNEVTREIDLLKKIKAKKFINVDGDGGIETLRNDIPYEARKEFLEILRSQLYISAMAVDPFPDSVGQASGVYIDFLYSLLELKAGMMETEFRVGLDEFIMAILKYLDLPEQPIEQIWTRNKPRNDTEVVSMIAQTPDTVLSDETKTKAHPLTEDWQEERKRIEAETKKRDTAAAQTFGFNNDGED